jgi:hypothetical protein
MSTAYPSLLFDAQGPHSVNLYDVALPVFGGDALASQTLVGGVKTFHGDVSEPELELDGTMLNGVNWTFYNRILILPPSIDVGNLITATTRIVQIWNGYFDNRTVENFQSINDEGITVIEPGATPYDLRPLELVDYTFVISLDGPAAISASYIWTIDGEDYGATIEGFRAFAFPFEPNFGSTVRETLEWRTNVLRAYSGKEQRRSVRAKPRRNFQYDFWVGKEAQQLLQNSLLGWQNRIFAVPVWMDKLLLEAPLTPGAMSIPLDTTDYSFSAGGSLIILKSEQEYEVLDIDTVGASIALISAVEQDWPAGTPVYPIIAAHLPVSVSTQQLTDTIISGTVEFTPSPDTTDPYVPTSTPAAVYDDLEVITIQPNWGSGVDKTFNYEFDTVDNGLGPITWLTSEDFPRILRRYSWLLKSREEITEFRAFLGRRQGRFKACWIPSWSYDFEIVADVSAVDTNIVTKDNGFFDFIGVNPAFDRIMIRMKNNDTLTGQIFYRRVTGLSRDPVTRLVTLGLDSALGIVFAPSDVLSIHYLFKCRLDTDRVLLEWRSNGVAVVNTNFITVLE